MDKTVEHLVGELKKLSKDVTDEELKDVATVSAGGNEKVRLAGVAGSSRQAAMGTALLAGVLRLLMWRV